MLSRLLFIEIKLNTPGARPDHCHACDAVHCSHPWGLGQGPPGARTTYFFTKLSQAINNIIIIVYGFI